MDEYGFFTLVCTDAGWEPTPERIQMFQAWHRREGMPLEQTWNPIATTQPLYDRPNLGLNMSFNIGYGLGRWNNANAGGDDRNRGVKVFDSPESGALATAQTLLNGNYPHIVKCFATEAVEDDDVAELATYVGSWAYGAELVQEWRNILADPRVDQILLTLQQSGIQQWKDMGNESIIMTIAKIQDSLARIEGMLQNVQAMANDYPSVAQTTYGLNNLLMSWRIMLNTALADKGVTLP